jgi:ferredoxin-NADP reductase
VYRASTEDDVVFRDELEAIADARNAQLHVLTGRRAELGSDPLSAAALQALVPDLADHDVYVCGPDDLTRALVGALRSAGVPQRRLHHESFTF